MLYLDGVKVAAQILFHAKSCPERPALVFVGGVATYGMLGRGLTTTVAALRRHGLPPGSVVAIEVGNPVHHIALILALELCGMTSLSVQTRYAIGEAGLAVQALLIDATGVPDQTIPTIRVTEDWFAIAPTIDVGDAPGVPDDRYYRIILTSGTTGRQKAVGYKPPLVGRFIMRQALMRGESQPRALSLLGLSTIGVLGPLFALVQGGTAFFARTEGALPLIRAFGIDRLGYIGVAHLEALVAAARASADTCPSLKVIHVSGSKLPADLAAEARARLCSNIIVSYASTEAGILSYARVGTPDDVEGSAGYLLPWIETETRAADGTLLPPGMAGLIRIKSPDMAEYVLPPDAPGQIDPDDWFHTGDIGYVRADGLLVVTGRSSDVINRRGIIVAPDYIEKALEAHPGIREAAVFTRADTTGREEIWAAVVPRMSIVPADVLRDCRVTLGDKTPDRLEIVDALPRTETGKLKRGAVRERFVH